MGRIIALEVIGAIVFAVVILAGLIVLYRKAKTIKWSDNQPTEIPKPQEQSSNMVPGSSE